MHLNVIAVGRAALAVGREADVEAAGPADNEESEVQRSVRRVRASFDARLPFHTILLLAASAGPFLLASAVLYLIFAVVRSLLLDG
jgi:hypothetical protein